MCSGAVPGDQLSLVGPEHGPLGDALGPAAHLHLTPLRPHPQARGGGAQRPAGVARGGGAVLDQERRPVGGAPREEGLLALRADWEQWEQWGV